MGLKFYYYGNRSVEQYEEELGIKVIFKICGVKVNEHRIPYFSSQERDLVFNFLYT